LFVVVLIVPRLIPPLGFVKKTIYYPHIFNKENTGKASIPEIIAKNNRGQVQINFVSYFKGV